MGEEVVAKGDPMAQRDAESGKELVGLRGHDDFLHSVAWNPDRKRLATGSEDKTAKIWDSESGKELLTLGGHRDFVFSVAWNPDGRRLVTASADNTVKVGTPNPERN